MASDGPYSPAPSEGQAETGSGFKAARDTSSWQTHALVALLGIAASVVALVYTTHARSGLVKFNDFYREAWPAYAALAHGHVLAFMQRAPTYVGSLVLRAPFAMVPRLWGAGSRASYVASAVPCMLATVAFCTWLGAQPRRRGGIGWASRLIPIVLCILSPLALIGLFGGHPEELLGGALGAGAVVLASQGHARTATVAVALAVINKPWALVVVPVVLVALPPSRRRALVVTVAAGGALLLAFVALHHGGFSTASGTGIGGIFNPPQLLWWFGPHFWLARESRIAIVCLAFLCGAAWWWRRSGPQRAAAVEDALLLLALVLLLRAALDPWNNLYYHVPFLFALTAYEIRSGRMPLVTVLYTVLLLLIVPTNGVPRLSPDVHAAMYGAVVIPAIGWMVAKLYVLDRGLGVSPSRALSRSARGSVAPSESA